MNMIYVNSESVTDKNIIIDNASDIRHLTKVLRVKAGDTLPVGDGLQWEYTCKITDINSDRIVLAICDRQRNSRELSYEATLFQGIPKGSKMDSVVGKAVELGATEVVPVFMDRTVTVDKGNMGKKEARWQKIADEARKQSMSAKAMLVGRSIAFREMLETLGHFDLVIFPYEDAEDVTVKQLVRDWRHQSLSGSNAKPKIAVIIGPEGGFSCNEVEQLIAGNIFPVSLGKNILRTETAGIVTLAMIMYELEL